MIADVAPLPGCLAPLDELELRKMLQAWQGLNGGTSTSIVDRRIDLRHEPQPIEHQNYSALRITFCMA